MTGDIQRYRNNLRDGMLTSLFNGRSPWYSAIRQLIFGSLAAGVTYAIGAALGTSLS
jgi:VIT1/CCC1 family predicted Fe2+/Mn2+ transporter